VNVNCFLAKNELFQEFEVERKEQVIDCANCIDTSD
jgi:hypothetical protein